MYSVTILLLLLLHKNKAFCLCHFITRPQHSPFLSWVHHAPIHPVNLSVRPSCQTENCWLLHYSKLRLVPVTVWHGLTHQREVEVTEASVNGTHKRPHCWCCPDVVFQGHNGAKTPSGGQITLRIGFPLKEDGWMWKGVGGRTFK